MSGEVTAVEKDFLIKTTIDQKKVVRIHGLGFSGPGTLVPAQEDLLGLVISGNTESKPSLFERLTIYFDFSNTTYAFDTVVRKFDKNIIRIENPKKLSKSLKRKYVRVKAPRDVRVLFHLANEDIKLDYPVCDEYSSISEAAATTDFNLSSLNALVASFQKKISGQATENTITMFRTRKPMGLEEEMITKTGRILYIPSTSSPLPKHDPYPEGRIITESIEESFEDPDFFINGTKFEKDLNNKKERGIHSEIWCPIVYYQYVIGYIYVANSGKEPASLDIDMVDATLEFSRVLAYFLETKGYFKTNETGPRPQGHGAKILDMTPDGMLMALPEKEIRTPIKEGTNFSVQLLLKNKHITCTGKVMRRYTQPPLVCYGISFINLKPEDIIDLHEFLYHRPYTESDEFSHEILPAKDSFGF